MLPRCLVPKCLLPPPRSRCELFPPKSSGLEPLGSVGRLLSAWKSEGANAPPGVDTQGPPEVPGASPGLSKEARISSGN